MRAACLFVFDVCSMLIDAYVLRATKGGCVQRVQTDRNPLKPGGKLGRSRLPSNRPWEHFGYCVFVGCFGQFSTSFLGSCLTSFP